MAYFHLASAIGGGGGGLGIETGPLCILFLSVSLCLLGAGMRLLWRGKETRR